MNVEDQIIIVDTDIFSFWLKNNSLGEPFRNYAIGHRLALSFITVGELYFWALKSNWGKERLIHFEQTLKSYLFLPCDGAVCENYAWARLQKAQERQRHIEPIGSNDYWIAACALRYNYPILTNNYQHFSRITGIKILGPHYN
jgi:tRNA(fMet)-specific endonuclease VapC